MGKTAKRFRERIGLSSSCFLRCFGFSRKISSDKPIVSSPVDSGYEKMKKQKKKKSTLRSHWFLRSTKIYMKNGESITEMEKRNSNFEDLTDKQKAFVVISHLADRENNGSGDKSVQTKEKDTNEERDINPDPLTIYGEDTCHEEVSCTPVKSDPVKPIGSGSKLKVRNGTRVKRFDPVIGIIIITLTLMIMLIWGRLCAIICSSTWCYFLPRLKEASEAAKRKRNSGRGQAFGSDLDLNSASYKKKVVLEGFLGRQKRVSL